MTEQAHQPKDYASAQDRLAEQDWAAVAKKGISGITTERGWILAFVVIFLIFQAANYFAYELREQSEENRTTRLTDYFAMIEKSREQTEAHRAQEMRRCQEAIIDLAEAVAREAERMSQTETQMELIEKTRKRDGK